MSKKSRLEAIIGHYSDGKPSIFAKFLGVAPSTISSWLSRDTMDYDLIFAKCENISSEWLLTGNGPMLKQGISAADELPHHDANVAEEGEKGIPLIPVNAMAGAFTGEVSIMEYECERYIVPAFRGADFLIRVKGDSMVPTYQPGDLVACKKIESADIFFQWNKTYVLDTEQGPIIKRVKPGSDSSSLLIVSDNPDYTPFDLRRDQIYHIAIVMGIIRLE